MALKRFLQFCHALTHLGESNCSNPRLHKRVVLSNKIALLMGIASFPYFIIYQVIGLSNLGWLALLCSLAYLAIPWMNSKGRIFLSRIILITLSSAAIFGSAWVLGKESGLHLFLLPCAWVSLILFDWEERKSIVFGLAWASLLLLVFELFGSTINPINGPSESELKFIHFSVLLLILVGQILVVFYFFQANRRSEQALSNASDTAKAADKAKSQFLANMSHEIRTPLNGVLGMSNLLLKSELGVDQKELVQAIHVSGLDLMTIIGDVLDLSKIEAGKMRLELSPFNLSEWIGLALRPFKHEAKQKQLKLTTEVSPDMPVHLNGDPNRVKQIINNLIGNALKFTHTGGVHLKVWAESPAPMKETEKKIVLVHFEIRDSGIGISEVEREKIFQPFSQADESSARSYGGTGLGLFLSKQIVEMMGGSIGFQSQLGLGSVFSFQIPFVQTEKSEISHLEKSQAAIVLPSPKDLRLLIVEDHPLNQKVLAGFLAYLNYHIDAVGSGQEAVEACSDLPYPLIFMDCHMPGMDGFTTTKSLRRLPLVGERAIIIGVTADAMPGIRGKCLEAGMNDVLTKPILSKELNQVLAQWLPIVKQVYPASPAPEKNGEWLDCNYLSEMDDWFLVHNPDYWEHSIKLFRDSAQSLIAKIRTAASSPDIHEMEESAHTLKGLCLMMGLSRMGNVCLKLESAKDTDVDWKAMASDLEDYLDPSLREMKQFILERRREGKSPKHEANR